MKPRKEDIQKWVDALRSGEYKQTKNALQNDRGFCCLGVACDVFIDKEFIKPNSAHPRFMHGGMPVEQTHAPDWLKSLPNSFYDEITVSLTELNDVREFTFDEIADVLEAIYILEVLDV